MLPSATAGNLSYNSLSNVTLLSPVHERHTGTGFVTRQPRVNLVLKSITITDTGGTFLANHASRKLRFARVVESVGPLGEAARMTKAN